MTNRKVISRKNLPTRFPLLSSLIAYLFLDKIQPPAWVNGAVVTIFVLLWIASIILILEEKQESLFSDEGKED